jgi:hypothetical protein
MWTSRRPHISRIAPGARRQPGRALNSTDDPVTQGEIVRHAKTCAGQDTTGQRTVMPDFAPRTVRDLDQS